MRIELPDVNVLLALVDPVHPHHNRAHSWYAGIGAGGWATCPLTENGFVRILSSPSYPGVLLTPQDAVSMLAALTANPAAIHRFIADDVSVRDTSLFVSRAIAGPKQITDIYLLGLCNRHEGTLVTLDTRITTAAINAPHRDLLRVL